MVYLYAENRHRYTHMCNYCMLVQLQLQEPMKGNQRLTELVLSWRACCSEEQVMAEAEIFIRGATGAVCCLTS